MNSHREFNQLKILCCVVASVEIEIHLSTFYESSRGSSMISNRIVILTAEWLFLLNDFQYIGLVAASMRTDDCIQKQLNVAQM